MHDSLTSQNIPPLDRQIENLNTLGLASLRDLHRQLFPGENPGCCAGLLRRKMARHLQVLRDGDLPATALAHAIQMAQGIPAPANLAPDADHTVPAEFPRRDRRLPPAGTLLLRRYQNRTCAVQVLEDGFLHENRWFGSLSAIARHITGSSWNGFVFFAEALQKGLTHAS